MNGWMTIGYREIKRGYLEPLRTGKYASMTVHTNTAEMAEELLEPFIKKMESLGWEKYTKDFEFNVVIQSSRDKTMDKY